MHYSVTCFNPVLRILFCAVVFLGTARPGGAIEAGVSPEMQGKWAGNARLAVSWCQQTNLPITLEIHPDGTVAGKIGDARLRNGWIEPNHGVLGLPHTSRSDYIIHGNLKGPIVAAERIVRPHVSIPLNLKNGIFVGKVETSGTVVGNKKNLMLSAASLELTRPR